MRRLLLPVCCLLAAAAVLSSGGTPAPPVGGPRVQVIVTLSGTPAAYATSGRDAAVRALREEQGVFRARLAAAIPEARVRRTYALVLDGAAVVLPRAAVARLATLPGVRRVEAAGTYRLAATRAVPATATRALGRVLDGATGEGVKIAVIDDGVDQTHPFLDPSTYTMPPGYPKGNRAYTTAKVIVARAFAPLGASYARARLPFDAKESFHGTHVAGIAAGNANTNADGTRLSGVAPRAFIGNYKALGIPTDAGVGLDGNAPELVAAIEAAVADGMDVLNLSLGEPEIEPDDDVVARALDAAAASGVVPVVAAGNDFDDFGPGSLSSPGSSEDAITVAAVDGAATPSVAGFSSSGPTPLSLRLKPDVSAPGVGILSSVPGGWDSMSGTSMATPYVSGTVALLRQRHPDWTVADVKAALVATGRPVRDGGGPALPVRAGGGAVDAVAADAPLVLSDPASLSLGLLEDGASRTESLALRDMGGGAGTWSVAVVQARPVTPLVTAPPTVEVPGTLALSVAVPADAVDGDLTGVVELTRQGIVRRIPFWGRLATSVLAKVPATLVTGPGVVRGSTAGRPALVTTYRYPDVPAEGVVNGRLAGPERLYRFVLRRNVANLGVVVLTRGRGVTVEPRLLAGADENRLTGYAALPFNLNPYLRGFGATVLAAGALDPAPGAYTIVFDSPSAAGAGAFTFRLWVDDRRPPSAVLLTRSVRRSAPLRIRVADSGSGVDPGSLGARIDGRPVGARLRGGVVEVATGTVARGSHLLRLQVSDYQETRNMENVAAILPNTRILRTRVTVR